jgi:ACR3 family arsenite efflux pump ArsB
MVFAFAPIVGLLLGLSAITVPWDTLLLSVGLYIVVPIIIAQALRNRVLAAGGAAALTRLLATLQPVALVALLTTLVLLFGFGADRCQQLLRACGRSGDQPVRLRVGGGAGDGRRRADRGARHAFGGEDR